MPSASRLIPINVFPLVVEDLVQRKIRGGGQPADFFFVQIGAHDGVHGDPIRPFVEKYHWHGLLVEPQPEIYQRLVANYAAEPQLTFAKAAVADQNGMATMYTFKKSPDLPDHATMLASFNRDALVYNGHGYQGEIEPLIVPALDLKTLLSKHKISQVDLLQIDTEGYDYEIIKLLSDSPIRPEIIHFESAFLNAELKHECGELLHALGYRALTIGVDTIAYRQAGDDNFPEIFANKGYDLA
jgi:FkbM family methyltransferase